MRLVFFPDFCWLHPEGDRYPVVSNMYETLHIFTEPGALSDFSDVEIVPLSFLSFSFPLVRDEA